MMEEELFQAADKKIAELNKLCVAQGRTDISEPEQQHSPVLVGLGDFENWPRDAGIFVIDKRLKRQEDEEEFDEEESDEEDEEVGKDHKIKKIEVEDILKDIIEVEDILKDIPARGDLAKKCRRVMILASAGMGKTTLLRRIAQNVRRGEYKELEGNLVLVLDFRPHLEGKKLLPSQVLLGDVFSDWGSERMKQRYQWIIDNPEKVVFIIDSLDTLPFDFEMEERPRPRNHPEYHKAATADVILRNILAKDWFAKSIIISSSRECKVRNLHPSFRPDRCILLDGLTEESVKDLIDGFLGKTRGEEVKNYIQTECPDVWPLLSIPVVLVFSMIGFAEDGFKPKTISGILIKFFQSLIRSSHVHKKDVLTVFNKLMPLALEGTRSLCVLFTPAYLKRFGLEPDEVTDLGALIPQSQGAFLSTKLMQNDGFLLYFNHQTQQEALAALHVMSLRHLAEFKTFVEDEVWRQQFTVVRRFICGTLLNNEVLEAAQELTEISDVDQKKNTLKRNLGVALEKYQQHDKQAKLLELFIDLSECREGVTELTRSSVKKIDFSHTSLSPSDVQAVSFVMKQCEYLEEVNLSHSHLNDEKMKIISKTIKQSNVKLEHFDVSNNKELGIEGAHLLGKFVKDHEVKSLSANHGSIQGCEALKKFIEGLGDAKLEKFDVNYNKELGVEGARFLGKLVKNHEVKSLSASGGSIQGCEALQKFIEGLGDAKLEKFDVSCNKELGVEGAHLLGKFVKNHEVKSLNAGHGSIQGSEALKNFTEGLGDAKLEEFDISGSEELGPKGANLLGKLVKNHEVRSLGAAIGTIHDRVSVEKFIEGLGDVKIDYLNLSNYMRIGNAVLGTGFPLATRSLLDFLPHVEKEIVFLNSEINESRQQLQQQLNEIGSPSLEVKIGPIGNSIVLKASPMDSKSEIKSGYKKDLLKLEERLKMAEKREAEARQEIALLKRQKSEIKEEENLKKESKAMRKGADEIKHGDVSTVTNQGTGNNFVTGSQENTDRSVTAGKAIYGQSTSESVGENITVHRTGK